MPCPFESTRRGALGLRESTRERCCEFSPITRSARSISSGWCNFVTCFMYLEKNMLIKIQQETQRWLSCRILLNCFFPNCYWFFVGIHNHRNYLGTVKFNECLTVLQGCNWSGLGIKRSIQSQSTPIRYSHKCKLVKIQHSLQLLKIYRTFLTEILWNGRQNNFYKALGFHLMARYFVLFKSHELAF